MTENTIDEYIDCVVTNMWWPHTIKPKTAMRLWRAQRKL
jgi:hypothetical protein